MRKCENHRDVVGQKATVSGILGKKTLKKTGGMLNIEITGKKRTALHELKLNGALSIAQRMPHRAFVQMRGWSGRDRGFKSYNGIFSGGSRESHFGRRGKGIATRRCVLGLRTGALERGRRESGLQMKIVRLLYPPGLEGGAGEKKGSRRELVLFGGSVSRIEPGGDKGKREL